MAEFGESDQDVDSAQAGNGSAENVVKDQGSKNGHISQKIIAFPELRPRYDDKKQPDLEAEKYGCYREQATHLFCDDLCFLAFLHFANASSLTAQFPDVVQLGATHASMTYQFDFIDSTGV